MARVAVWALFLRCYIEKHSTQEKPPPPARRSHNVHGPPLVGILLTLAGIVTRHSHGLEKDAAPGLRASFFRMARVWRFALVARFPPSRSGPPPPQTRRRSRRYPCSGRLIIVFFNIAFPVWFWFVLAVTLPVVKNADPYSPRPTHAAFRARSRRTAVPAHHGRHAGRIQDGSSFPASPTLPLRRRTCCDYPGRSTNCGGTGGANDVTPCPIGIHDRSTNNLPRSRASRIVSRWSAVRRTR